MNSKDKQYWDDFDNSSVSNDQKLGAYSSEIKKHLNRMNGLSDGREMSIVTEFTDRLNNLVNKTSAHMAFVDQQSSNAPIPQLGSDDNEQDINN